MDVHFTEEKATDGSVSRVCPSCNKTLNNGLKAMCMLSIYQAPLERRNADNKVTKPCGHVICAPCVNKFMAPSHKPDPHASKEQQEQFAALQGHILCYVCETDITPDDCKTEDKENGNDKKSKKKDKNKEKNGVRPGLVEVSSEGTGFAGKGDNVATRFGVSFQC